MKHPTLPFAKVGRDAWLPLEALEVNHDQYLPSSLFSMSQMEDTVTPIDRETTSKAAKQFAESLMETVLHAKKGLVSTIRLSIGTC